MKKWLCGVTFLISTFGIHAHPNSAQPLSFIVEYSNICLEEAFGLCPNALLKTPIVWSTNAAVFFEDAENDILFIDFAAISDHLLSLTVKRKKKLILSENISVLPYNMIYEIDLSQLKKGKYTIELTTTSQTSIQKNLTIK